MITAPNVPTPNAAVHADAVRVLSRWEPGDPGQRALREAFLGFLAARPDACARSCVPGHLTASAVVLSHDGTQVLLTLHPRVGRWVQLGGHCEEGDAGLATAALREATEESGIGDLEISPQPLHLDVHPITCSLGVPTRHFDVRFLVHAPVNATPVRSSESLGLAWWPVTAPPPDVAPALALLRRPSDAHVPGLHTVHKHPCDPARVPWKVHKDPCVRRRSRSGGWLAAARRGDAVRRHPMSLVLASAIARALTRAGARAMF